MAVNTQDRYNALITEKFKIQKSKYTGSKDADKARKRIAAIDKELDTLAGATPSMTVEKAKAIISEQEAIASRATSQSDPQFIRALEKIKVASQVLSEHKQKSSNAETMLNNFRSSEEDARRTIQQTRDAADLASKNARNSVELEKKNAIRLATGQAPLATKSGAVTPAGTWVQPTQDVSWVEKQFTDGRGMNVNAVYMGTQPVRSTSRTAGGVGVGAKTVLAQEATAMFVKDPKLQAKVIQSMKNAGVDNVNQLTAYMQWQSYVEQARVAYKGGQGLLVTPMDVLNMSLKESNATKTSTQKYTSEFKPDVIGNLIDSIFQNTLGMNPTQAQKTKYLAEFKALSDKGSIVTTTTTGRNSSSVTKGGFSQEDVAAKLTKNIKTSPEFSTDLQERQALDFNSAIDKLMSRGM